MKLNFTLNAFAILFAVFLFLSNNGGPNGNVAGAPGEGTCSGCHGPLNTGSGNVSVSLSGNPSNIMPNTSYTVTVSLNQPGATPPDIGGFQVVATNGINNSLVGSFQLISGQGTALKSSGRVTQATGRSFFNNNASWNVTWTSPASLPSQVVFYTAGNAANGNGGNDNGDLIYTGNAAFAVLPVELTYFRANTIENLVQLNWQTASEINSDYFEIQRSTATNSEDFETIGRVQSVGNSTELSNYEFIDENPLNNQELYYRLKQVDFDGTVDYSSIEVVKIRNTSDISIFPNPVAANQDLTIQINKEEGLNQRILVSNLNGQVVFETTNEGINGDRINIPTIDLANGAYFLSVFEAEQLVKTERIIVQK